MVALLNFRHAIPAYRVFCGADALMSLPGEMDRFDRCRVAVVAGRWLIGQRAVWAKIEAVLGSRLVGRFDGVRPHSALPSVEEACRFLRETRADAVIALGGGSAIVTARAASVLLAEGGDIRELCTRRGPDGRLVSPKLLAPKIPNWVVPTTPVTAYAKAGSAVHDPRSGERLALFDPKTRARGIFLDPAVAQTSPAELARSAGLNAFAMAAESIQGGGDDPLADAALSFSLRMLAEWLPRLQQSPDDPEVRIRLMLAALLCGQGSDYVGGGLAQALSHAAGPRSNVANGVVEALLLPHAMRFAAGGATTAGRLSIVASALDISSSAASNDALAIDGIRMLLDVLGVPTRLRDVGISRDVLPSIADHAMDDWSITQVPRRVERRDVTEVLTAAW